MGAILTAADEGLHDPGPHINWNESRYVDFWDREQRVGGWLRIGMRPNARYAEMSVCLYLPDGKIAYFFERARVEGNQLDAGGQEWAVQEPFVRNRVRYHGPVLLLEDGWSLTDPGPAFRGSPRSTCEIDVSVSSRGPQAVMGADQADIERIFLPGQADAHYQHLAWTSGTVRVGDQSWSIDAVGGKDHSWGPRNWHAKRYLRWFTAAFDDGSGFMLMRAVGPSKQTRAGHVWSEGQFQLVDDFSMRNSYGSAPHFELISVAVSFRAGGRQWSASAQPQAWLPLRHRQSDEEGQEALLRIVKSPALWTTGDGLLGVGACEFHDLMVNGQPVGLDD